MRLRISMFLATVLLGVWLWFPATAHAREAEMQDSPDTGITASVRDYQAVRKVAMALAVIGVLVAVTRLTTSEAPHDRHRAETLLTLTLVAFVFLAADGMIARGVAGWFHFPASVLPVFWQ